MKIAIVHDFLTKIGGAEKVLLSLLEAYDDATIYTLLYDKKGTNELFSKYNIVTSRLNNFPKMIRKPKFLLSFLAQAIEEFNFSEYDIVISSSNSFAHGIITGPHTFHLTYCHSPMRYAWDWYHQYLNENHISYNLKGLYVRNLLTKIRIWDKIASHRTDLWIANSNHVKKRIAKYYHFDSEVIYPPVNTEGITPSYNVADDYYVVLSRLEPYKRIDLVVQAFNDLNKPLVIIGTGSELESLRKIAKKNIEFLGWQSDQSVYEYIRNSKALIFPGEEDFGIVPVEAMACGRPVIAYQKGGALETIIPNKTGLFFENQTPESIVEAVKEMESNYGRFSPKDCRLQAEKFSNTKFISNIKETIENNYEKYLTLYNLKK